MSLIHRLQRCFQSNHPQVTKILFKDVPDAKGNIVATGVSFDVDGTILSATASKEVILSTGVIQTPQLLELSGKRNTKAMALPSETFRKVLAAKSCSAIWTSRHLSIYLELAKTWWTTSLSPSNSSQSLVFAL